MHFFVLKINITGNKFTPLFQAFILFEISCFLINEPNWELAIWCYQEKLSPNLDLEKITYIWFMKSKCKRTSSNLLELFGKHKFMLEGYDGDICYSFPKADIQSQKASLIVQTKSWNLLKHHCSFPTCRGRLYGLWLSMQHHLSKDYQSFQDLIGVFSLF